MDNLEHAAQEYLAKRAQLGPRVAAQAVIQTFGVTALDLSEYLRDHGQLLKQQASAAVTAASEVRYMGRSDYGPDSRGDRTLQQAP